MQALVSPVINGVCNTEEYWSVKRAAVLASVYPSGKPTGQPDGVEAGWGSANKPEEADSITRLTVSSPGGREGGSVIYADVCHPKATPINGCMLFMAGHCSGSKGWYDPDPAIGYVGTYAISPIRRALSAGITVVAFNLSNYGDNPTQSAVISGSLRTMNSHAMVHLPGGQYCTPQVTLPADGPSLTRLWTDHPIIAMNWVELELEITKFALVGHSGGGGAVALLGPLEERFSVIHLLQGGWAYPDWVNWDNNQSHDWEAWNGSDLARACEGKPYAGCKDQVAVMASFPGRKTVVHVGTEDEGWDPSWTTLYGDKVALWRDAIWERSLWISRATAGASTLELYEKPGPHAISSAQAEWVVAHIAAYL